MATFVGHLTQRLGRSVWLALGILLLVVAAIAGTFWFRGRAGTSPASPPGIAGQAKIVIDRDGIVRVEQAQMSTLGLDLSRPDLRLQTAAEASLSTLQDVPFEVIGQGTNTALLFYGQANMSRYSAQNVYWLSQGGPPGARWNRTPDQGLAAEVQAATTATTALHLETDRVYMAQAAAQDDHWYWNPLTARGWITETAILTDVQPTPAVLYVGLWSGNSAPRHPNHHVRVAVNGQLLADDTWDGIVTHVITVSIPLNGFHSGANLIGLELPADTGAAVDQVLLNRLDIEYQTALSLSTGSVQFTGDASAYAVRDVSEADLFALDITDPLSPVKMAGSMGADGTFRFSAAKSGLRKYAVSRLVSIPPPDDVLPIQPANLKDSSQGADYLVIAPAEFEEAVKPLVEWRRKDGLGVRVIDLQAVYDEFGAGKIDPAAIRAFLRYSHDRWNPAPRFVLLVGDASYDYRDNLGARNHDWLPTQLVQTEFTGETASDVWYTLLDDDSQPDIALGRLPAQTAEELKAMIDKIVRYEQAAPSDWQRRALLVSDNNESTFQRDSADLGARLASSGYITTSVTLARGSEVHDRILSAIDQGVSILNYIGHGSLDVWGDEKALQLKDAASLKNGDRLPILTTYTCLNGFFQHPEADSLAEALLWQPDGGVVAAVVPSGRSLSTQQKPLAEGFYTALLGSTSPRLGEALLEAQRGLGKRRSDDVLLTFNLLGDPALKFQGIREPGK